MALTDKEVQHIATLARIRLNEEELPHYAKEINGILKWIEQLGEVNTDGVTALSSVSEQLLPWRADVVNDGNQQEAVRARPAQRIRVAAVEHQFVRLVQEHELTGFEFTEVWCSEMGSTLLHGELEASESQEGSYRDDGIDWAAVRRREFRDQLAQSRASKKT